MRIYDYLDYKKYVNEWIELQPNNGHGQLRKLSQSLNINSVIMSQVFRGDRDLNLEQALGVSKFIGHTDLERDYYLLLVQKAKAGNYELKSIFEKQAHEIKATALQIKNRIQHQKLTDESRAIFYSNWYYSAVRLASSIPALNSISAIAIYLGLNRTLVAKLIDFLKEHGLVIEKNKKLSMGPSVTHVGHDSPFVNRHRSNWRLQGMLAMEKNEEGDLFYSGPMALSEKAATDIKNILLEALDKTTKKAVDSDSEVLHCLNIDWFKIGQ